MQANARAWNDARRAAGELHALRTGCICCVW